MSTYLYIGNDMGFELKDGSYVFIAQELWRFKIRTNPSTMTMTSQPQIPVGDRVYDRLQIADTRQRFEKNNESKLLAEMYVMDIHHFSVYTDTLMPETRYIGPGNTPIWWSNSNNVRTTMMSSLPTIPHRTVEHPSYRGRLLGDFFYFARNNPIEGLRRWILASNRCDSAVGRLAAIHLRQYSPNPDIVSIEADYKTMLRENTHPRDVVASIYFHLGNLQNRDSVSSYRTAAQYGNVYAANTLAGLGRGLGQTEIVNWYTYAANGGLPVAMLNLGRVYQRMSDLPAAMAWFHRASLCDMNNAAQTEVNALQTANNARNVVVILQTRQDTRGSFAHRGLRALGPNFIRFTSEFNFVHLYVDDISHLVDDLEMICMGDKKIAHLIILAHGTRHTMHLMGGEATTIDTIGAFARLCLAPYLAPHSSIFLAVCSAGHGGPRANNIAQALANELPNNSVWGADNELHSSDIKITRCSPIVLSRVLDIVYDTVNHHTVRLHRFRKY